MGEVAGVGREARIMARAPTAIGPEAGFEELMELCRRYQAHHGVWPSVRSTPEKFAQAGMPGYCGPSINLVIWQGGAGLARDPDYLAKKAELALAGTPWIDLDELGPRPAAEAKAAQAAKRGWMRTAKVWLKRAARKRSQAKSA